MRLSQQMYRVMVMEWRKLVWQPRIMYLERWSQQGMEEGKEMEWNEEVMRM